MLTMIFLLSTLRADPEIVIITLTSPEFQRIDLEPDDQSAPPPDWPLDSPLEGAENISFELKIKD